MPRETFYNLSEEKRQKIMKALVEVFSTHTLEEATVKRIVENLGISRGSFYQYFESMQEVYFYVLGKEFSEVHLLFRKLLEKNKGDLKAALNQYGDKIYDLLTENGQYKLYEKRYLYWNADLDMKWREYINKKNDLEGQVKFETEGYRFISAIVHSLIQRLFLEKWDRKKFIEVYKKNILWIMEGISHDAFNGKLV